MHVPPSRYPPVRSPAPPPPGTDLKPGPDPGIPPRDQLSIPMPATSAPQLPPNMRPKSASQFHIGPEITSNSSPPTSQMASHSGIYGCQPHPRLLMPSTENILMPSSTGPENWNDIADSKSKLCFLLAVQGHVLNLFRKPGMLVLRHQLDVCR